MSLAEELLKRLYDSFNARDMAAALGTMRSDVVWANGLDGGYVYGLDGVRDYWTKQWATMESRANPTGLSFRSDGSIEVHVRLVAMDNDGKVLFDTDAVHVFRLDDGLISRFEIRQ